MSNLPPQEPFSSEQPDLFSGDNAQNQEVVDISEIARKIAENAPNNPYQSQEDRKRAIFEQRGEDLGAEQTGLKENIIGIEEVPGTSDQRQVAKNRGTHPSQRRPFEMPGKDGRTNSPGLATSSEVQAGLTDEEIDTQQDINRKGIVEARKALEQAKQNNQP
jgi:hypothetical protein